MYHKEILDFIESHRHKNTAELSLLLSKKKDWPKEYILNQINGQQKATKKFPFLEDHKNFEFPSPRALAQASSEVTARYKASLVSGNSLADLSGGMGIDSYFFAQNFKQVDYIESNPELFDLSKRNFATLGATNIRCHQQKAEDFLAETKQQFDLIYLDPDRRDKSQRHFKIEDCSPNVIELLPQLFSKSQSVLVKLSPLLDIKAALQSLLYCKTVYVVSVKNDCKELLFHIDAKFEGEPQIKAVNLESNEADFSFSFSQESNSQVMFGAPENYLYEPNASLLKAGAFKSVAEKFELKKLAPNTHLYTSVKLEPNFPGRCIKIEKMGKPQKGFCQGANVISRNFPLKPAEIRKKYKIKEGDQFLYACSLADEKKLFVLGSKI